MRASRISRRGVLALLASALPFAAARSAAAQLNGCDIGFVNGLLQIDPTCVITGPGGPLATAPGHLAQPIVDGLDDVPSLSEDRVERLEQRRDRKHDQKGNRRDRRGDHKNRRRNRRQERDESRRDRLITCDDFDDQKEAIEWMHQFGEDADVLDPNNDGVACEHLDTVRCGHFSRRSDLVDWLTQHGWSVNANPFNLNENSNGLVCPQLPVSCDDFATQTEAKKWWDEHGEKGDALDPNNNGIPCEDLPV